MTRGPRVRFWRQSILARRALRARWRNPAWRADNTTFTTEPSIDATLDPGLATAKAPVFRFIRLSPKPVDNSVHEQGMPWLERRIQRAVIDLP